MDHPSNGVNPVLSFSGVGDDEQTPTPCDRTCHQTPKKIFGRRVLYFDRQTYHRISICFHLPSARLILSGGKDAHILHAADSVEDLSSRFLEPLCVRKYLFVGAIAFRGHWFKGQVDDEGSLIGIVVHMIKHIKFPDGR